MALNETERTELRRRKKAAEEEIESVEALLAADEYVDVTASLRGTMWEVEGESEDGGSLSGIELLEWPENTKIPTLIWENVMRAEYRRLPIGNHGGLELFLSYRDGLSIYALPGKRTPDGKIGSFLEAAAELGLQLDFRKSAQKLKHEVRRVEKRAIAFRKTLDKAVRLLGKEGVLFA